MILKKTTCLTGFIFLICNGLSAQVYPYISSSANAFTVYNDETSPISYNKDLGMVNFVHRKSATWNGFADANSGAIQSTWSLNNGTTWDSTIFWTDATNLGRYPSGAIVNPINNANINNAIVAGSGPSANLSTGAFTGNWFSSGTFSSGLIQTQGKQWVPSLSGQAGSLSKSQLTSSYCDMQVVNGAVFVLGKLCNDLTGVNTLARGFRGVAIIKGTVNGQNIVWTLVDSIIPPVVNSPNFGKNLWENNCKLAFSPNGQIAYILMSGVDATATQGSTKYGYQPIVYKSTAGGSTGTWQRVLSGYDWVAKHPQIASSPIYTGGYVDGPGTTTNEIVPSFNPFNGCDITVDNLGRLHYITTIQSQYTSTTDSLRFMYTHNLSSGLHEPVWHAYTDGNTCWSLAKIDSLNSTYGVTGVTVWAGGATPSASSNRIQMSRSNDGTKIFFGWTDTNFGIGSGYNTNPNTYIKGFNTAVGKYSLLKQISTRGDIYWNYFSRESITNYPGAGDYTIPGTFSTNSSLDVTQPVNHYYINNATINTSEMTYTIVTTMPSTCISLVTSQVNINCSGSTIGSASVSTIGGAAPFSYSWNTAPLQTGPNATNLGVGVYTVTVTDALSNVSKAVVTIQLNPNNLTFANTATRCSDVAVNIPITTTYPSTYSWIASNNPNTTGESITSQTSNTITNIITNNSTTPQIITYTITPTIIAGGCVSAPQTITITLNPKPTMTSGFSGTVCSGSTVNFSLSANIPSSFAWIASNNPNVNGESLLTQTTNSIINTLTNTALSAQVVNYSVTPISTLYSCIGNTQPVSITVNQLPIVNFTGLAASSCLNHNYTLTSSPVGGTFSGIGVSGTNFNSTISGSGSVTVIYSYTDANSCTNTSSQITNVTQGPPTPDICMVSVDSVSMYNLIAWEKTLYPSADSFIVYRETSTNIYKRISALHKSVYSQFTDTVRSIGPANGNPNTSSYRYKLQIRDTCGNYSALSPYHNSIYFSSGTPGTYSWNSYLIEGAGSTPVSTFDLFRDNNSTGLWTLVGSCAGTQNTLNDAAYASYPNAIWRVYANGFNCNPTLKASPNQQINKSKSNVKNNLNGVPTNETIYKDFENSFSIAPNPVNDALFVTFNDGLKVTTNVSVTDVLGNVIYKADLTNINKTQISLSDISSGVYFLSLKQGSIQVVKKFIKE